MSRIKADVFLALAGLIWGFGFVAQKDALSYIGPCTFIACKFLMSALFVVPFLLRETRRIGLGYLKSGQRSKRQITALCLVFAGSVIVQQVGMVATNVTKAAFLTGLYIVMVPFAASLLYRQKISAMAFVASILSVIGVALLSGGGDALTSGFTWGDGLIVVCAFLYALQVPMLGHLAMALKAPFALSFLQYLVAGVIALVLAVLTEHIDAHAIAAAWLPILYSGIASGGIAYTLQAVAQQHTPSTDSAILMSTESLFGAIGGAWLLDERLRIPGYIGCAAIMASVILVELVPVLRKKRA